MIPIKLFTVKSIIITGSLLLLGVGVFAQTVKKVKITEVEQYIQQSDHPLVISFWATWCQPCVEEIPWLQEGIKKYEKEKIEFVLVSLDFTKDYPAKVTNFIKQRKFDATLFFLDETDADYFCPKIDARWSGGIPATLLINKKTGYRKFLERQIMERQVEGELKALVTSPS